MRPGKGLLRPDPAKLARRFHASLHPALRAGGTPKGSAQLTPCQRMDQGQSGTCHAHSAAGSVWTALNAAGAVMFVPSPVLIASCTYADVRAAQTPPGQPLPPLVDTGADLSDDATALARWGVSPILAPTTDGRYSDVENDPPGATFPEPSVAQLEQAGHDLIGGEYQIPVDAQAPVLCALALDNGLPIWLGFFVDSAFESAQADTVVGPPNESDPNGGGHAVYLSGYRTAADGSYEFRLENSWGPGWADGGAVWVGTPWLKACWMLWPMAIRVNS